MMLLGLLMSAVLPVAWIEASDLTLEGRGFTETEGSYDRLPSVAEKSVPPRVWELSRHAAGMCVRFVAEEDSVRIRYEATCCQPLHRFNTRALVTGCDVYWKTPKGNYRFQENSAPEELPPSGGRFTHEFEVKTTSGAEYLVYFPNRSRVHSFKIGGKVRAAPTRASGILKPVVHYGTSIVHGGLASRPGLAFAAVESRVADVPVVNLGFSGSGRMEPALADEIVKIDASLYVVDCGWNLSADEIRARLEPFVRRLVAARPNVPILLAACCSGDLDEPQNGIAMTRNTAAIREAYERLSGESDAFAKTLHYLPPEGMLPQDGDATGDHTHPNDYGMVQMGHCFGKALKGILGI